MNPLVKIPPAWRKRLYVAWVLAGVVIPALTQAGVDVGSAPQILAAVGVALGLTAASNTPAPVAAEADGAAEVEGMLDFE